MNKERCQKHPEGGGAHNDVAFGRKRVLPFFLRLSILRPFFSLPKYTPPILGCSNCPPPIHDKCQSPHLEKMLSPSKKSPPPRNLLKSLLFNIILKRSYFTGTTTTVNTFMHPKYKLLKSQNLAFTIVERKTPLPYI